MKNAKKFKSWVDKKLENPSFKKTVEEESERLSIGEQLVRMRLAAQLTQADVAKKVGTTASAICRYENAEYDRYEVRTLRKITEACGGKLQLVFRSASDEDWAA
ncbi:helix-turn-helix transcriptional regulator [Bdellovibrionota bacterium FG-1]